MAQGQYVIPEFSKGRVRKAGNIIASSESSEALDVEVLKIVRNWRAAHAYPLNGAAVRTRQRIDRANVKSEMSQRLKRMDSIESKLRDGRARDLSSMQDIAGCRVIVESVDDLKRLRKQFDTKNNKLRIGDPDKYDYVWTRPKNNGYRSVHYVEYCRTKKDEFFNMRVETQLRTRRMHYWATAVETVDTFFDQRLKAGGGDADWDRFFQLCSGVLARDEDLPSPKTCPISPEELKDELARIESRLNALNLMEACRTVVNPEGAETGKIFVLRHEAIGEDVEGKERQVSISTFSDINEGLKMYSQYEDDSGVNAVLVKVDNRDHLRRAYPNYFTDSHDFIKIIRGFLSL